MPSFTVNVSFYIPLTNPNSSKLPSRELEVGALAELKIAGAIIVASVAIAFALALQLSALVF